MKVTRSRSPERFPYRYIQCGNEINDMPDCVFKGRFYTGRYRDMYV